MRSVPWWWLPAACVPCQRVLQMPVEDDEVQDDDVEEDEDEDYTEDEVDEDDVEEAEDDSSLQEYRLTFVARGIAEIFVLTGPFSVSSADVLQSWAMRADCESWERFCLTRIKSSSFNARPPERSRPNTSLRESFDLERLRTTPFAVVLAEPLPESTLRSSFTLKERFVDGTGQL
eukprot:s1541_g19.t1